MKSAHELFTSTYDGLMDEHILNTVIVPAMEAYHAQFQHPVPANKSIADLNHIVINACMNLYAITEKHEDIDKIINAVKSFTTVHPVPDDKLPDTFQSGWKHGFKQGALSILPNNKEVNEWFTDNIGEGCSASSGIYKFRQWLKERSKNTIHPVPDEAGEGKGWISVEDRLPDDSQCVLVYCAVAKQGCKFTVGMNVKELHGFYTDDDGLSNVTHWQPLPAPPNVKHKVTSSVNVPEFDESIESMTQDEKDNVDKTLRNISQQGEQC